MTLPPPNDLDARLFLAEAGGDVPEADLHGLRADEARAAAERLLHAAFLAGAGGVRLVHGKGEGRLRDAVHRALAEHPLVAGFREAPAGGVTAVVLIER